MWSSSTLPVAFRLAHIDRQPDGWALFPRNHRPVAFLTPPPRPCLGAETPAQQEKDDAEREDADEPKNWISHVQHSQNFNRCCANSCTFKPDGKSGATSLDLQIFPIQVPSEEHAAAKEILDSWQTSAAGI
jgi:hypothetical protein